MNESKAGQKSKIKEEILKNKSAFTEFFKVIPFLACIVTPAGRFKKINPAWSKALGYSQEEMSSMSLKDFVHPEDITQTLLEFGKKIDGDRSNIFTNRCLCHDGAIKILEWDSNYSSDGYYLVIARDITGQKQAEEMLKEKEIFFRESLRIARIGSYKLDCITGFWVSSEVLDDIFGIDADYVRSVEGWSDIIHRDDAEMMNIYLNEEIFGQHRLFDKEYRITRKIDGEMRWVKGHGELSFDSEGSVVSMIGTIQDITERKRAEIALSKYKHIVSSSTEMMAFVDKKYNYIVVNEAYSKAFNLTPEDFLGRSVANVFGNEVFTFVLKPLLDRCFRGDTFSQENWHDYPFYGKLYIDTTHFPYRTKEDRIMGCVVIVRNITEQKILNDNRIQSEEALKESEIKYRTLVDEVNQGFYITDANGFLIFVNRALATLFGFESPSEMIGRKFTTFLPPEKVNELVNLYKASLASGISSKMIVTEMIRRDGTSRVIEITPQVLFKDGESIGSKGFIQDISDRKQMEKVMQRSQKLESLGVLAGGIAHDFNNLLGGIMGNIQMAMLNTSDEKVSTYLGRSLSSIDRTRALTGQLLTFAKGGEPIKRVENLIPFIQETVQLALSGSSVSSQFQVEDNLWFCDCDKNQIGQVIDNLTINAQQAMTQGGVLEVSARNISLAENEHNSLPAGKYVKLSIRDQGMGISKEVLQNIFDPYYTTKSMGQGLGLSTCYSIVNRHGGSIDVESELGEGSAFHVYLPAFTEPLAARVEDQEKSSLGHEHRGHGTFLVMDDEKIIRESMKDMLEDLGYTVVLKDNGQEAIDFFMEETKAGRKITGMIFDLTIPGAMGGEEAIGKIRKICPDTPAFVSSGYSSNPVIANPEDYGFNASICKPFVMDELSDMLEVHMKKLD